MTFREFLLLILLFAVTASLRAQDVTLSSLLEEMTDRSTLTRLPEPAYRTLQASSYDRRSERPGGEFWFGNADRSQFVRAEQNGNGTEWVMMDERGPGAVVRFWMTFAGRESGEGMLRIYVDGSEEPVVAAPVLEVMSGGLLAGAPLCTSVSERTEYIQRGHNLYLPIPYANSIKITYESERIDSTDAARGFGEMEAVYYNINYRSYSAGTQVQSFSREVLDAANTDILETQLALSHPFADAEGREPTMRTGRRRLAPGEDLRIDLEGERAISELAMYLESEDLPRALRGVVIEASFDGKRTLYCPLGEFFGTGYQLRPYTTFFTQVEGDGRLRARWPMPFAREATLRLVNLGDVAATVSELQVHTDEYEWDDARSMHFGGNWQNWHDKDVYGRDRPEDLTWAKIEGTGIYVGDVLTLFNNKATWWGEGDEKVYVDGETFPSHFGTGTEDYYAYAWCRPETFDHPFNAQPDGRANKEIGTTTNLRWRALDAIPFTESLQFDMELLHWRHANLDYAPAVFYYLRPAARSVLDDFTAEDVRQELRFAAPLGRIPRLRGDTLEGELLEIARVDGGNARIQTWDPPGWSADGQLWWRGGAVGDTLELAFLSDRSAELDLELQLTRAVDYGRVAISLNGGEPVNFEGYHKPLQLDTLVLPDSDLREGENRLRVVLTGKHPDAYDSHMFGIDRLVFQ